VSLSPDQRRILEAIAKRNHTSLAFVVRYALEKFVSENQDKQLNLVFPSKKVG
jgi:predicted transcriptional regulator